jgi:hypothetical protein
MATTSRRSRFGVRAREARTLVTTGKTRTRVETSFDAPNPRACNCVAREHISRNERRIFTLPEPRPEDRT